MLYVSLIALFLFFLPLKVTGIVIDFILCSAIAFIIKKTPAVERGINAGGYVHRKNLLFLATILLMRIMLFYQQWHSSTKVRYIAEGLHITPNVFLGVLIFLLAVVSAYALDQSICILRKYIHKKYLDGILCMFVVVLQFIQLQYSTTWEMEYILTDNIGSFLINIGFNMLLFLTLWCLLRKQKRALIVSCIFVTLFSVANYYVVLFHGRALFPSEFANAGTAMQVLSGYKISITPIVMKLLWIALLEISVIKEIKDSAKCSSRKKLYLWAGNAVFLVIITFSPIIPQVTFPWLWQPAVNSNGFWRCAVQDSLNRVHPITKPQGYDSEKIDDVIQSDCTRQGGGIQTLF